MGPLRSSNTRRAKTWYMLVCEGCVTFDDELVTIIVSLTMSLCRAHCQTHYVVTSEFDNEFVTALGDERNMLIWQVTEHSVKTS